MNILTITAPQYEPVSIADVTEAWGISGDDARVTKLIKEARQWAEGATGRALMAQRRELRLLDWPSDAIRIYCRPARAIVSIKYIDSAGTENTWDAANYALDTAGITPNETDSNAPALVRCAYGVSWPTATLSPTDPIR